MAYWTAARYMLAQERLALHFLRLAGFEVYLPRLREQRDRARPAGRGHAAALPRLLLRLRSSFSGTPRTGRRVRPGLVHERAADPRMSPTA